MRNYRLMTSLLSPLVPLWLRWRRLRGKEDPKRLKERYGIASAARPPGTLLWLHAASVGEANSVLLLIRSVREHFPPIPILLTTGTLTSARLMRTRLPQGVIHQYVPVDTPAATRRFIRYWKPELAFWVESEFWPNLVMMADYYQCFMGVINARMSERSFQRWRKHPALIHAMLSRFNIVFAQSEEDATRLQALGAKDPLCYGNVKYDAALLPCDEAELLRLKQVIGSRPLWLAASTHPGEEAMIAQAHALLAATRPGLLTIIVPRHPERGPAIARMLGKAALRSKKMPITADTSFYVADTLGELGLFYRLCEVVFMGGSLVRHGGQNPLEPARLSCAILTGPHTQHFAHIYQEMEAQEAVIRVGNAAALAAQVGQWLGNAALRAQMQDKAAQWITGKGGAVERILTLLAPIFTPGIKS